MPFVQKNINTDDFAQELFEMYPISMRKVMDVFPQYFFQTFFQINRDFSYEEKTIDRDKDGNLKERYQANLHIIDKHMLKFYTLEYLVSSARQNITRASKKELIFGRLSKLLWKSIVIKTLS